MGGKLLGLQINLNRIDPVKCDYEMGSIIQTHNAAIQYTPQHGTSTIPQRMYEQD
jgi:hypothetical protein